MLRKEYLPGESIDNFFWNILGTLVGAVRSLNFCRLLEVLIWLRHSIDIIAPPRSGAIISMGTAATIVIIMHHHN